MGQKKDKDKHVDVGYLMRRREKAIICDRGWYKDIWHLAKKHNIPTSVALARLELKWHPDDIISTPHEKENLHAYWRNRFNP